MQNVKKIAIFGIGFMGGSLALALKKSLPSVSIVGYARKDSTYKKLSKLNIVDIVEKDIKKTIENADIVVLASPVYSIIDYFKKIAPFLKEKSIVIDLGSSKELIEESARKYLPKKVYFVGCHPLCGSDKSGAEFSNPNLYKGALCLVTSSLRNEATLVIKKFWEKIGSRVITMDAKVHDKILSRVSHLEHLVSFSLTRFVPEDFIKFTSSSFRDLTRISNSPAYVWADIFISNKKNIIRDVEKFIEIMENLKKLIAKNEKGDLIKFIECINKKHKLLGNPSYKS